MLGTLRFWQVMYGKRGRAFVRAEAFIKIELVCVLHVYVT